MKTAYEQTGACTHNTTMVILVNVMYYLVQGSSRHTYLGPGDVFVLYDGQEWHLYAGEHSELPGQA